MGLALSHRSDEAPRARPAPAERRRLVVILNPAAGRRRPRRFQAALAGLETLGCAVTLRETAGPGDAARLARSATPADGDLVVVAGGDGTINEAANGLVSADGGASLPLAVIPLGTANVLACEIGLGRSPALAARAIVHGPLRAITPGRFAGGREGRDHFLLMAGIGVDAHAVAAVDLRVKRRFAEAAYLWAGLTQLARSRHHAYQVEIDGAIHPAASVIVAKSSCYGGPYVIAPGARLDSPGFEVCLFERAGLWPVLTTAAAVALGQGKRVPGLRRLTGARVRIGAPAGDPVQCDGDIMEALPVDIEARRGALTLAVPREGKYG